MGHHIVHWAPNHRHINQAGLTAHGLAFTKEDGVHKSKSECMGELESMNHLEEGERVQR